MKIIPASPKNASEIFEVLSSCAADMRANGIMQWNENYPKPEHVEADLKAKNLYLAIIDEKIAGVISIDGNQSPEYSEIPWKYREGQIMVIHRLAVSPGFQKAGIGRKLMDFALEHALQNDYTSIRLDAYSQNERTLNFYRNRGYEYRGDIYFAYRDEPFYCFEKKIRQNNP